VFRPESLESVLKALRLPTFSRRWEPLHQQAIQENWSLPEYLFHLAEEELHSREQQRLQRYQREAHLPPGKGLEQFNCSLSPASSAQFTQLASDSGWLKRAENLLLFGPSGTGKSHLAAAIGYGQVQRGQRVLLTSATALIQQLQQAHHHLQLAQALTRLERYSLLIVDDLGYVKPSNADASVLFELIAHRYESGSLLITSNQPFSQWESLFGDALTTVAAIDRLVHHALILEVGGPSYRRAESERRAQQLKR